MKITVTLDEQDDGGMLLDVKIESRLCDSDRLMVTALALREKIVAVLDGELAKPGRN